jgi:hypothetical protein
MYNRKLFKSTIKPNQNITFSELNLRDSKLGDLVFAEYPDSDVGIYKGSNNKSIRYGILFSIEKRKIGISNIVDNSYSTEESDLAVIFWLNNSKKEMIYPCFVDRIVVSIPNTF